MLEVKSILTKNDLDFVKIEKSSIGFINDVYLTEKYVIKIYSGNVRGYARERWFYSVIKPDYAPRLVALGEDYIVLERIFGVGLYHVWPSIDDIQREAIVKKIAAIVTDLNNTDYTSANEIFQSHDNWTNYIKSTIVTTLTKLIVQKAIPEEVANKITDYVEQNAHVLEDSTPSLVYADLHFDNLIMNDTGKIYLIDYETLCAAPKDYMLDVWNRMMVHPFIYANEKDHEAAVSKDYVHIMEWLKEYAPSLFQVDNLTKRLSLYGIDYDLRIMLDYPNDLLLLERIELCLME